MERLLFPNRLRPVSYTHLADRHGPYVIPDAFGSDEVRQRQPGFPLFVQLLALRQQVSHLSRGIKVIDDTYNASPDSIKQPNQASEPVQLEADRFYFLQVIHKSTSAPREAMRAEPLSRPARRRRSARFRSPIRGNT